MTAVNRSAASRTIDSQPGRIRPSAAGSSRIAQIASGVAPISTRVGRAIAGGHDVRAAKRRLGRPPAVAGAGRLAASDRRRAGRAGGRGALRSADEHGRSDDPGVVAQLGRHDRHADGQVGHELVGVLAHAAAEDEQARAEQPVDRDQVLVEIGRPRLPRQAAADPGVGRRAPLGVAAADLHVAELGVRDERPVDEQRRAEPGPEGEHEDRAHLADARPRSASRRSRRRRRR